MVLRNERSDADTALRVTLRHRVNQHHILLDTLQMARRDIGRARVDKLAIDLVREEEQIVLLDQIADAVHLLARIEVARRVVRVTDQNSARALVDKLLELLDLGQREALLDRGRDGADDCSGRDCEGHIVGVGRLGNDDLIAWIEARHKGKQHGLRASRSDDDVVGREFYLILVVVANKLLAQRQKSVAGAILQQFAVDFRERIQTLLRRGQVGLTDIEVVDFHSTTFGRIGQRHQLADRRSGHTDGSF